MPLEPAGHASRCVALLDDMGGVGTCSRLYSGHVGTLSVTDHVALPVVLGELERLLAQGLHAVGLFTYELGARMHSVPGEAGHQGLAQVLLFERCALLDEQEVVAWLQSRGSNDRAGIANVLEGITKAEFEQTIGRIQALIGAGDTYQVNYTFRIDFDAYGSPAALYARLRQRQRVPYGAFILQPDGSAVLSLSPELFVRHNAQGLEAKPMKGTARAGRNEAENEGFARTLAADPKNRAENVMIVDLLRNDLGRIAKTGSVSVPALFEVNRFGDVLQMTSTILAQPRDDCNLAELFDALYPCGSITGAPKRRTMQIIGEVESSPRGIYTGAIGWFGPMSGAGGKLPDFCLSVPIRTLVLQAPHHGVRAGRMGVGAGIVADSDPAAELEECRLKARFLTGLANDFELIETMRATREEGCRHLQQHLARLASSANYFNVPLDVHELASAVRESSAVLDPGKEYRVRVALLPDGQWNIHASTLQPIAKDVRVFLSDHVLDEDDVFLRHKSSVRPQLDAGWKQAEARGGFDCLFFNRRGELAQGGRTNVFVNLGGRWFTPPLESGALPGVMRSVLLGDPAWEAAERVLTRTDLLESKEIVLCNALRGALRADLVIQEPAPLTMASCVS